MTFLCALYLTETVAVIGAWLLCERARRLDSERRYRQYNSQEKP